jgi:hypothetical protein
MKPTVRGKGSPDDRLSQTRGSPGFCFAQSGLRGCHCYLSLPTLQRRFLAQPIVIHAQLEPKSDCGSFLLDRGALVSVEECMRPIAIASLMFATLSLLPDGAQAAPWCAQYGGGRGAGGTNCGFYSFQQCMAAASGNGGFCNQNAFENPSYRSRRYRRD